MNTNLHKPIIIWPCYEPAAHRVELTETDLVQHVLISGSTGSGKSTLLTAATSQLIEHGEANSRIGLLVLDAKNDDIVTRVREAARRAGRENELMVYGHGGDHTFDLFGTLRDYDDVDRIARRILLGAEPLGQENAYWQQSTAAMIGAALTLLLASKQSLTFESVVEFMRKWFLSPLPSPPLRALVKGLTEGRRKHHPLLESALDQFHLWQILDARTRSNLQSCLLNTLRSLFSPAAVRCFAPGALPAGDPAQAVNEGRICVVSVNALAEPELARFFFRLAKQIFFETVQQRQGSEHPLCGLLVDELPLLLAREDVDQLATVRSKRCFILAATQGMHGLSERVGLGPSRALVNNFNTQLFLRTREPETAVQAFVALGTRKERRSRKPRDEGGLLGLLPSPEPEATEVPVCPLGALGQLSPHQAYVVFADGRRTETAVWFVPWFEMEPAALVALPPLPIQGTMKEVTHLMQQAGFLEHCAPAAVVKACTLRRRKRRKALRRVSAFFLSKACLVPEGLNTLPDCWLVALPGILWSLRKPHWTKLPFFISRVAVVDGALALEFAQEQRESTDRVTAWDKVRIALNARLYPSRWRPLSRWHRAQLRQLHPELLPAQPGPGLV